MKHRGRLRREGRTDHSAWTPLLRLIFVLVAGLLTGCRQATPSPTAWAPTSPSTTLLGTAWDDRAAFGAGLINSERAVLEALPGATVYQMDIELADDLTHLRGRLEVRYTNTEPLPLQEVWFRLYPNLLGGRAQVDGVTVDGRTVEPAYELSDSAMRFPLLSPLQPGEHVVIAMDLAVQVPTLAETNYGVFSYVDGVLSLAHFYPIVSVFDDEGWNVEIPPPYGDLLYADSSFYLVRVKVPVGLTVVASGIVTSQRVTGGQQELTIAAGPARDFDLTASADYVVVSEKLGDTLVNSYALAELGLGQQAALRHAVDALRAFSRRFGPYPLTEFDVVSTPTLALGVEYPGLIAMAKRLYPPKSEYPPAYLESTVAHEVAHQWFYSTVGNDQLDEPWLDEALAQYATLLYWQDLYGPGGSIGFDSSLDERWARVDHADIPIGLPVQEYSEKEYGAIVYGRGPRFLEALATRMGQEAFDAFLREYYGTHKWGVASGQSFKQLAEGRCQCDLTPLFQEWVWRR